MTSHIRVVHSFAPAPCPEQDLHIWTPPASEFEAWWRAAAEPLWVGVDTRDTALPELIGALAKHPTVKFVVYSGIYCSDSEAPCGCSGCCSPCDYHRHGEGQIAACGCSKELKIICAYHTYET